MPRLRRVFGTGPDTVAQVAAWLRGKARLLDRESAGAGLAAGSLWALGNFASVHAVAGLGQAVGFPLTQVCVLVSSLYGVCCFGELPGHRARGLFFTAAGVVLFGAVLLAGSRDG